MAFPRNALTAWLTRYAAGLRFPQLFLIVLGLFVLDLLIPDALPFVDEILLALITAWLATVKSKKDPDAVDAKWRRE